MNPKKQICIAFVACAIGVAGTLAWHFANKPTMDHTNMTMGAMSHSDGDQSPPSLAFGKVNAKMHREMNIKFIGNVDSDFIQGMIPHHQGAIEMARIELEFGSDADVRKLANSIIAAQETEIKFMEDWLKTHPTKQRQK